MTAAPLSTSRVVLVTGGNRGIGLATAIAFIDRGHRVAVLSRDGSGPDGGLNIEADVVDSRSVERAFQQVEAALGPVEVVVANAGITRDGSMRRMTDDDFDAVVLTNLGGAFRVVRRASASMVQHGFGRIILLSSVAALLGSAGQANYAASKAALIGLARSSTRELARHGITSNVIAPGFIETRMTAELPQAIRAHYLDRIPVGRTGAAEEVASTAVWLASDDAAYISGAVIPVDGGLGMGH